MIKQNKYDIKNLFRKNPYLSKQATKKQALKEEKCLSFSRKDSERL